jgi:4-hydroxybenzoyl-CoA thioesterase
MPFRTSIPVRFGDVDHAGIVYYPQYYIYFHEAFEDFFNLSPFSYFQLLDRERIGFPTVHVETDFKQPLRYGDSLDIAITVDRLGGRSLTLHYEGHRHRDGVHCVTAKITLACIDLDTFKSRDIPADLRELFTRFRL